VHEIPVHPKDKGGQREHKKKLQPLNKALHVEAVWYWTTTQGPIVLIYRVLPHLTNIVYYPQPLLRCA